MFHKLLPALLLVLAAAACAPLPPSPADIQAKRFEPVPGKAVIYVVRNRPDLSDDAATIMVDDRMVGTTYPGTYLRVVVEPGRHQIRGYAGDNGRFVLDVPPDGVYFVQQSVTKLFTGMAQSQFRPIPDSYGRSAVMHAELIGGG
jgi:hypothetical protein